MNKNAKTWNSIFYILSFYIPMNKYVSLIITIITLVVVDQLSKYIFFDRALFSDFFLLEPFFNPGISRSLPFPYMLSIWVGFLAIWLFLYLFSARIIKYRESVFLIAGALGNTIDRIFFSWVRDFIFVGNRFPIFNTADILLTCGIILVIISELYPCITRKKN